jgi:hypothetical protein
MCSVLRYFSLQAAKTTTKNCVLDFDHVDATQRAFATFKFNYRSKGKFYCIRRGYGTWLICYIAALQSLLIVPRSPSPTPLEDRDLNTLTPEESRELIRRFRERDEAARHVKREGGLKRERSVTVGRMEGGDDGEVSFVSEKRRRLPVTIDEDGVETIDLT